MKPLAFALSGVRRASQWWRGDGRGNPTNVQNKPICNHHNKFPCTMNMLIRKERN
jgi:hypothetical protein